MSFIKLLILLWKRQIASYIVVLDSWGRKVIYVSSLKSKSSSKVKGLINKYLTSLIFITISIDKHWYRWAFWYKKRIFDGTGRTELLSNKSLIIRKKRSRKSCKML